MTRSGPGLGVMAVVAAALGMLFWSWGTWPHPYVDFGRELYVPWRLSEGEVLYRDLAWVLPVNFGIHHPQSNATMDRVPGGRSSAEWDAARVAQTLNARRPSSHTSHCSNEKLKFCLN